MAGSLQVQWSIEYAVISEEAAEVFWSMDEVVIDVRGLFSFYENWSIHVKKLKVVIPTWNPKRCGQKEKSELEQQFTILTQRSWPKFKEIRVVVCFWGGFWGLFGEKIEKSLQDNSVTEDSFREIDLKWDALAAALLDLKSKPILKDVVKRSYVESPNNKHSFLPLLLSLNRSDTQPWHEDILRWSVMLNRWETAWEMTAPNMDADGKDLCDWVRSFIFQRMGRYNADAKSSKIKAGNTEGLMITLLYICWNGSITQC